MKKFKKYAQCIDLMQDLIDLGLLDQDISILQSGLVVKSAIVRILPTGKHDYIFIGSYEEIYIFLLGRQFLPIKTI